MYFRMRFSDPVKEVRDVGMRVAGIMAASGPAIVFFPAGRLMSGCPFQPQDLDFDLLHVLCVEHEGPFYRK
jgi:hypothetical protein